MISAARICALIDARQYDAAIDAAGDAPAIDPHDPYALVCVEPLFDYAIRAFTPLRQTLFSTLCVSSRATKQRCGN